MFSLEHHFFGLSATPLHYRQGIFACLSPEIAHRSYEICYALVPASTVIVLVAVCVESWRRKLSWLPLYLPLWLLQPGWQVAWQAVHSELRVRADCGFSLRGESIFLFVTLATMLVTIVRSRTAKRLFLFRLIMVCWIVHALVFLVRFFPYEYAILSAVISRSVALEVLDTIEIGQAQTMGYTVVLTIVCCALYIAKNRRIRRQRADAETVSPREAD